LIDLFQKVAGVGGAHENGVSFLQAFFFAPPSCKEKSDYES
jgi:hypothetical protein